MEYQKIKFFHKLHQINHKNLGQKTGLKWMMIDGECITPIVKTKSKTSMLKSSLCDYADACILVSGTITVVGAGADDAATAIVRNNKQVIFKNCAPLIECLTELESSSLLSSWLFVQDWKTQI